MELHFIIVDRDRNRYRNRSLSRNSLIWDSDSEITIKIHDYLRFESWRNVVDICSHDFDLFIFLFEIRLQ